MDLRSVDRRSARAALDTWVRNHLDPGAPVRYTSVVGSLVDYDEHYRKGRGQCGDPFPDFAAFFDRYDRPHARVLDLGCGQGRDALLAARHGHEVVGVDLSEIGIAQMVEDAEAEGLDVAGVVSDVLNFRSRRKFDVVLLDRVLHLLLDDDERIACLDRAARLTRRGGHALVADVPMNRPLIHGYFDERHEAWTVTKRTKNYLFAQKSSTNALERPREASAPLNRSTGITTSGS